MACLIGCRETATQVNLVDPTKRMDIYTSVAKHMNAIGARITRKIIKHPVMTTFYGSVAQPRNLFGAGSKELKLFNDTLSTLLPGAMRLMKLMQSKWDSNKSEYVWELPDGHVVVAKVTENVTKRIEVDSLNHATFSYRARIVVPVKTGRSLAANIIHSVDGYIVREMLRLGKDMGIDLATIHDSFWAHPNDMNIVRRLYVTVLADIAESNLMQDILNSISDKPASYKKVTNDLGDYIRKSEYALS